MSGLPCARKPIETQLEKQGGRSCDQPAHSRHFVLIFDSAHFYLSSYHSFEHCLLCHFFPSRCCNLKFSWRSINDLSIYLSTSFSFSLKLGFSGFCEVQNLWVRQVGFFRLDSPGWFLQVGFSRLGFSGWVLQVGFLRADSLSGRDETTSLLLGFFLCLVFFFFFMQRRSSSE